MDKCSMIFFNDNKYDYLSFVSLSQLL